MVRHEMGGTRQRSFFRTIDGAVAAGIVVILAGLVVPAVRSFRLKSEEARAEADLIRIREALVRFIKDVGTSPTRGRGGLDGELFRLVGPGLIPDGAYYRPDEHQGLLADHLVRNRPCGAASPGYDRWLGPYLEGLSADPWGFAYVVVAYPLSRDDDRDAVIVSAGRNGTMDGNYASVRDPVPAGDDLIEVVVAPAAARAARPR